MHTVYTLLTHQRKSLTHNVLKCTKTIASHKQGWGAIIVTPVIFPTTMNGSTAASCSGDFPLL